MEKVINNDEEYHLNLIFFCRYFYINILYYIVVN